MIEGAVLIVAVFVIGPALIWTCEWLDDLMEDRARLQELESADVQTPQCFISATPSQLNALSRFAARRHYGCCCKATVDVVDLAQRIVAGYVQQVDSYEALPHRAAPVRRTS